MPKEELKAAFSEIASEQSAAIQAGLTKSECVLPEAEHHHQPENNADLPPLIDIFLNPSRKDELDDLAKTMKQRAFDFFSRSDMRLLYPQLFRLLWQSTLPCLASPGLDSYMLRECQLAGSKIPCHQIFTRLPTDSGKQWPDHFTT